MNEIEIYNEEWRDVVGYEGKYAVSNMGRVKSLRDNKGNYREKILRLGKDKNGYLYVNLCKDGIRKNCLVHRLVATAFIENPNGYRCVNHKDENPSNNVVENLEWCTHKYNLNYGTCQQRRVANTDWKAKVANTDYKSFQARRVANTDYKAIAAKIDYKARTAKIDYNEVSRKRTEKLTNGIRSKQVYQYSLDGNLIKIWSSTRECGRQGFNQGTVAACCRGKLKHYKNFIWSYHPI